MPNRLPDHLRRSNAERARESREARKAAGWKDTRKNRPSGPKPYDAGKSRFASGEFVAVDGEGFSEGPIQHWRLGANRQLYSGREHFYAYLSASDGSEIYSENGRLGTKECLDFLLAITERNPKAIVVAFGASYDMTQILYDLSLEQIQTLLNGSSLGKRKFLDLELGGFDYRLELRPRRSLVVMRWPGGTRKFEPLPNGRFKMTPHAQVTLWDVWGFFQDSFTEVMRKWIPNDPDYQMILSQKGNRKFFQRSEIDTIKTYNAAELRCLVAIMDRVRDAVRNLGLTLNRWDGAGAIAAAILKREAVKDHKKQTPPNVFHAARHAYSGGHIEAVQIGHYDGPVYHYDVNSAYPAEFANLPSLQHGFWRHGKGGEPPAGFTMVRTRWVFNEPAPFYPLFYRDESGSILYPRTGDGWHWFPEWEAAKRFVQQFGAKRFDVIEWWHFQQTHNATKPFAWIADYYKRRMEIVAHAKAAGIEIGEEKIIKLGLNSLYGKTAQQVGAARDGDTGEVKTPPYFQLEWAGMVTAGCRAKLMQAALEAPEGIISFATDGIFSTRPIPLETPREKQLGKWEAAIHAGMTMVMPGVYWLHEENSKPKHYSRGFDKEQMEEPERVHRAWKRRETKIEVELTRLIGFGTAIRGGAWWDMRGMFITSHRSLRLNGDNSKRYPVTMSRARLWKELAFAMPRENESPELSAPFEISWLVEKEGYEEEREAFDAELA
jgi:hypothetical protein